jgi:glycosyltransferase involved in cell wall biosynthesis
MLKLSIITVNLNNAAGLRKTIKSVQAQTFKNFEHIIIDGGSSDGSVNVIEEFKKGFSYWVSEPDDGIYQGMNKGTKKAKGEYCLYLNSGDYLCSSKVLEKIFKEKFSEDLVYGDLIMEKESKIRWKAKNNVNLPNFIFTHPNTLIKFSLLKKLNGYSEQFKGASDRHFFMRAIFIYGASYRHITTKITVFNMEGFSADPKNAKLYRQENLKIEKEIMPNVPIRLEMTKLWFLINGVGATKFKCIKHSLKSIIKNRDVYVWGTGLEAAKVLDLLEKKHIRVEAFLDSNEEFNGLAFAGYKICTPEKTLKLDKNIFVVIASEIYCEEMAGICKNYGLNENKDFYIPFS